MRKIFKIAIVLLMVCILLVSCNREETPQNNTHSDNRDVLENNDIIDNNIEQDISENNSEMSDNDVSTQEQPPMGGSSSIFECARHTYGYHGEYLSSIFDMNAEQFEKRSQLEKEANEAKLNYYLENDYKLIPECPLNLYVLMEELGLTQEDLSDDLEEILPLMQITQEHIDVLFAGDEELFEETWCNTKSAFYHNGRCYCIYDIFDYDVEILAAEGIPGEKVGDLLLKEAYDSFVDGVLEYIEENSQQKLHDLLGVPTKIFDDIDILLNNKSNRLIRDFSNYTYVNEEILQQKRELTLKYKNFYNEIDTSLPNITLTEDDYDYMAKLICKRHKSTFHGNVLIQLGGLTSEQKSRLTELQFEAEQNTLEYLRNNDGKLPERCFLPLNEILRELDISKEELEQMWADKEYSGHYFASQNEFDSLYLGDDAFIEECWRNLDTATYGDGRCLCVWDILDSDVETLASWGVYGNTVTELLKNHAKYIEHAEDIINYINENTQSVLAEKLGFTKEDFEEIEKKIDKVVIRTKEALSYYPSEYIKVSTAEFINNLESFEVSANLDVIDNGEVETEVIGGETEIQGGETEPIEGETQTESGEAELQGGQTEYIEGENEGTVTEDETTDIESFDEGTGNIDSLSVENEASTEVTQNTDMQPLTSDNEEAA